MMMSGRIETLAAMKALDNAGGRKLTNALRAGYAKAARVIRDKARVTTAFRSRTGLAKKSWKISQSRIPFNHAKVSNTAHSPRGRPYPRFLEGKPHETRFMEKAARSTGTEQLNAVGIAVRRHLARLRAQSK